MPVADRMLIAWQLAKVDAVYTLETQRYRPDYLTASAADRLPWTHFADAVPTLFRTSSLDDDLDILIVAKSVTWSDRDINTYARLMSASPLRSVTDLTEAQFVALFGWHIQLARKLSATLSEDVYVTHGFNPDDSSPDAHSVVGKFHTHVHVPDLKQRRRVSISALSTFERLALIEPFSIVAWDVVRSSLASRSESRWRGEAGFGFFTLVAPLDHGLLDDLRVLAAVISDVNRSYLDLVRVFTDGNAEGRTGFARNVPVSEPERQRRLTEYELRGASWLSVESLDLLRYLARNIVHAAPRDPPSSMHITTSARSWIAKGLSGAINFVASPDQGLLRFDFAPRIISTSGATKVLSTHPTIIRKDSGPASPAEQRRMNSYSDAVVDAASRLTFLSVS